nr:immunoglobulin heavy chain junction region [Mus musculus]
CARGGIYCYGSCSFYAMDYW